MNDSDMEIDCNNYESCCLFDTFHNCGPTKRKNLDWPENCVDFSTLSSIDVTPYLKSLNLVPKSTNRMIMSEKQLIMNRIMSYTSTNRNCSVICPVHRYTYGVHWKDNPKCGHPDHPPTRRIPKGDGRAKLDIAKTIPGFIYGSRLCSKHRKNFGKSDYDNDDKVLISENNNELIIEDNNISDIDFDDQFTASILADEENTSNGDNKRSRFNDIFCGTSVTPLKSSAAKALEEQSDSSIRRLTSKYNRGLELLKEEYAEAIAPGQGCKLIALAEESNINNKDRYETETTSNIIEQLKVMYKAYVTHKVPFREQVQLLSLVTTLWSPEKIMSEFNCSIYAAKLAKKFGRNPDYKIENKSDAVQHRQRTDPSVAKHFIAWLVETGSLVSGTYGLTNIKLDDGMKVQLPKQILHTQKYHIIMQYRKYCDDTKFNGYGVRKLYDILNSINPSQQHSLGGIDEFVNDGIEGWNVLKEMIEKFAIPQVEKKRLQKQVDMSLLYQKHGYSQHCEEQPSCLYHCINCALSDPITKEFQSPCFVAHSESCSECDNVLYTLSEIEYHISSVVNLEDRQEFIYDFHNASESIIELFRHMIRGVCQDNEKTKIVKNLTLDSTFAVFDWGQKIIPQRYRESQKDYYGKKGLSILVGSFVVRNSQTSKTILPVSDATGTNATTSTTLVNTISTTTTTTDDTNYITSTYIVALGFANQTDLDTLSATQLIVEKFHKDYPQIKYLFKRSDNASNFSSHSTAEAEYLICKKFGLQLVVRDYSEPQKGRDVCDRMCGVAKSRMRSWHHSGHDILNGFDVKEGMEAYGGIKNLKIAVAEISDGEGYLSRSIIPNVSSVRSIRYSADGMTIHKASGIGAGLFIPFKNIEFDINVKLVSDFDNPMNTISSSSSIKSSRADRAYNETYWCPEDNCTMVFYNIDDLNVHILSNEHQINVDSERKRSSNDVARLHLMKSLKTVITRSNDDRTKIIQQQISSDQTSIVSRFPINKFINHMSCKGWALRVRKPGQKIGQEVKDFIEKLWLHHVKNGIKLRPEIIHEKIRCERNGKNEKLFKPEQYVSIAQIKYQIKKLNKRYEISTDQQLIIDLMTQTETTTTT